MDAFFTQYPRFTRAPDAGLIAEFNRLTITQNWSAPERHDALDTFHSAMVDEFNLRYGIDDKSLASWQNLCRAVGIVAVPGSITKCKKEIKQTHVNLVDLIERRNDDRPVKVFASLNALRKYTKKKGKTFPRDDAKAGGILKHLLRVMSPKRVPT